MSTVTIVVFVWVVIVLVICDQVFVYYDKKKWNLKMEELKGSSND